MQDQAPNGGLTDPVLELLASPLLGPCKVQDLILSYQHYITGRGIAALAGGRFPGGFICALLDYFAAPCATHVQSLSVSAMLHRCRHKLQLMPALNVATLHPDS